jgi:rhodanese-related sulfurtransferase
MPQTIQREKVQEMQQNAQLVEVLPPKAYGQVHLPGAVNIPLAELNEQAVTDLDKEKPVIVYCYDQQ